MRLISYLAGVSIAGDQVTGVGVPTLTAGLVVEAEVRGQQLLVVPHDLTVRVQLLVLLLLQVPEVLEHPGVRLAVIDAVDLLVVVGDGPTNQDVLSLAVIYLTD